MKKITKSAGDPATTKLKIKQPSSSEVDKVTLLVQDQSPQDQAPMPTLRQWRELAACRDSDPNLFFPVGATGPALEQIEEAKAVCQSCMVREDCLQFSLRTNQEAGVWGGYAEDERRRLRKRWLAERRRAAS